MPTAADSAVHGHALRSPQLARDLTHAVTSKASSMGAIRFSFSSTSQIRHFRVALQALAKIGTDLLIEGVPNKLVLRAINSSKSAFFAVTFNSVFFDSYHVFDSQVVQTAVLIKHFLSTFRTQRVASMACELRMEDCKLTVSVVGDNKLTKRYNLECMNQDILYANVDKSSLPTEVVAEASELNRLLASFQVGLEEITIIANPESAGSVANGLKSCQLQSFFDPERARSEGSLHTSLALDTNSLFLSYRHDSDSPSDVTFNVKDFKAFVALCEHMGANVIIRFDQPGVPLVAEPHFRGTTSDADYRAELVLATLMESQYDEGASLRHQAPDTAARSNQHQLPQRQVSQQQQQQQQPQPNIHHNYHPQHHHHQQQQQQRWQHAAPGPEPSQPLTSRSSFWHEQSQQRHHNSQQQHHSQGPPPSRKQPPDSPHDPHPLSATARNILAIAEEDDLDLPGLRSTTYRSNLTSIGQYHDLNRPQFPARECTPNRPYQPAPQVHHISNPEAGKSDRGPSHIGINSAAQSPHHTGSFFNHLGTNSGHIPGNADRMHSHASRITEGLGEPHAKRAHLNEEEYDKQDSDPEGLPGMRSPRHAEAALEPAMPQPNIQSPDDDMDDGMDGEMDDEVLPSTPDDEQGATYGPGIIDL